MDGGEFHPLFAREILPWQIQSTLMPNVAILMASATQGYLQDPTAEMSSETLVIKDHVLKLVSKFIQEDFYLVGNQAMRIVIHLVIIEVRGREVMWDDGKLMSDSGGGAVQKHSGSTWRASAKCWNCVAG